MASTTSSRRVSGVSMTTARGRSYVRYRVRRGRGTAVGARRHGCTASADPPETGFGAASSQPQRRPRQRARRGPSPPSGRPQPDRRTPAGEAISSAAARGGGVPERALSLAVEASRMDALRRISRRGPGAMLPSASATDRRRRGVAAAMLLRRWCFSSSGRYPARSGRRR